MAGDVPSNRVDRVASTNIVGRASHRHRAEGDGFDAGDRDDRGRSRRRVDLMTKIPRLPVPAGER